MSVPLRNDARADTSVELRNDLDNARRLVMSGRASAHGAHVALLALEEDASARAASGFIDALVQVLACPVTIHQREVLTEALSAAIDAHAARCASGSSASDLSRRSEVT